MTDASTPVTGLNIVYTQQSKKAKSYWLQLKQYIRL